MATSLTLLHDSGAYSQTEDTAGSGQQLKWLSAAAESLVARLDAEPAVARAAEGAALFGCLEQILRINHDAIEPLLPLLWPLLWRPYGGGVAFGLLPGDAVMVAFGRMLVDTYSQLRQMDTLLHTMFAAAAADTATDVMLHHDVLKLFAASFRSLPEGQLASLWETFLGEIGSKYPAIQALGGERSETASFKDSGSMDTAADGSSIASTTNATSITPSAKGTKTKKKGKKATQAIGAEALLPASLGLVLDVFATFVRYSSVTVHTADAHLAGLTRTRQMLLDPLRGASRLSCSSVVREPAMRLTVAWNELRYVPSLIARRPFVRHPPAVSIKYYLHLLPHRLSPSNATSTKYYLHRLSPSNATSTK
jgi:hypothetical protein